MNQKKNVVRVTIVGDEYSIRSDETPEHTRAVADFLDERIRNVLTSGSVVENHRAAILAALQITDELLKARQASETLAMSIRELSADIRRLLPPTKR